MASVIALSGSKGGTGKSTLSHLVAHGAGSLPRAVPAVVFTTDPEDKIIEGERRYVAMDGRDPRVLADRLEELMADPHLLIVIDGAANRREIDLVVAEVADLVVIPFGPSQQDADRAQANLAAYPKAVALPNRWPTHKQTAARVKKYLSMFPADRRLPLFPAIPKLDGWLTADGYEALAYDVASPSRGLVTEILAKVGVDPRDLHPPAVAEPSQAAA